MEEDGNNPDGEIGSNDPEELAREENLSPAEESRFDPGTIDPPDNN